MGATDRAPVRALLAGMVDYAGLFPPAGLEMRDAVRSYAAYRAGPDAWALGRFVVPAARLEEFAAAAAALGNAPRAGPWRLSALLGADPAGDLARIRSFHEHSPSGARFVVDAVELRAASAEEARSLPREVREAYVEIPLDGDPRELVGAIREAGGRAKVRTGGVTPEAFPPADALLGFLRACVEAGLPFKATAGLHHPVAGRHRLTCETGSPAASMYGYLNLIFATALLLRGAPEARAAAALAETDAAAFRFDDGAASWREFRLDADEIRRLRERGMVAFGSCSFREPLDELAALLVPQAGGAPLPPEPP